MTTFEDFFDIARAIRELSQVGDQIRYASAINRLYYGIIHFAIYKFGLKIRETNRFHKEVGEKIRDSDHLGHIIYDHFINLQNYRVKADYLINESISEFEFQNAFKLVDRMVEIGSNPEDRLLDLYDKD